MKHLVKKANRYYIHWNIPKDVRHLFDGLAIYSRSLKTDNLGQAIMRRDQLLTELEGIVRKARVNPERQQFLALVKEIRKAAGEPPIEQDEENIEEAWSTELQVAIEKGDTVRADAIRAAMGWEDAEGIEAKYGITLMEAAKLYTETTEESLDPSTLSRLNLAPVSFASFLKLKDIHLADIDKRDVIAWVLECAKDKAPRTVKAYATCLSKVWDWAYRSKEVSGENPFKDLDIRLTSSGTKRTAFTVEQVAALNCRWSIAAMTFSSSWNPVAAALSSILGATLSSDFLSLNRRSLITKSFMRKSPSFSSYCFNVSPCRCHAVTLRSLSYGTWIMKQK